MKFLTIVLSLLAFTTAAYAGCWHTQVTNKMVDPSNGQRTAMQCFAQRIGGGTWALNSSDTKLTRSGAPTYTLVKYCTSTTCVGNLLTPSGAVAGSAVWNTNGAVTNIGYGSDSGSSCNVVYVMVAANPVPVFEPQVRYCRQ